MLKLKPAGKILLLIAIGAGLYAIWRYALPEDARATRLKLPRPAWLTRKPGPPKAWAPGSKESPIRIAIPPSASVVGALIANGGADTKPGSVFDSDSALTVRMEVSELPAACSERLAKREVQFYVTDLSGFVQDVPALRAKGLDPVVVLLCAWSRGADAIVADPKIKSIDELADGGIGVVRGAPCYFFLRTVVDSHDGAERNWPRVRSGLRLFDDPRAAAAAYAKREVDAVVLPDPYIALAMGSRESQEFASTRQWSNVVAAVLVADRTWVREHADTAARLVRGWLQGVESASGDGDEARRLLRETFAFGEAESRAVLEHVALAGVDENQQFFGVGGEKSQMLELVGRFERVLREDLAPGTSEPPARLMESGPFEAAVQRLDR
jgi:hypothetical protein